MLVDIRVSEQLHMFLTGRDPKIPWISSHKGAMKRFLKFNSCPNPYPTRLFCLRNPNPEASRLDELEPSTGVIFVNFVDLSLLIYTKFHAPQFTLSPSDLR